MAEVAVLGGIAVASSIMSNKEQAKASRAERKAQKRANAVESRRAQIANQRARKQAAAQTMQAMSSNIASAASFGGAGAGTSSMMGANQSFQSNLSSSIGYQDTILAANVHKSRLLQRGADQSARHQARAGNYAAIGGVAGQATPFFMPTGGTS